MTAARRPGWLHPPAVVALVQLAAVSLAAVSLVSLAAPAPAQSVGLEGRIFEGLGDAYSGDFVSLRNRSWEVVARFGIAFER